MLRLPVLCFFRDAMSILDTVDFSQLLDVVPVDNSNDEPVCYSAAGQVLRIQERITQVQECAPNSELNECDWDVLSFAIEFLRVCRDSPQWNNVSRAFEEALVRNMGAELFVVERISIWDLLLHGYMHQLRLSQNSIDGDSVSQSREQVSTLLVNGQLPRPEALEPTVEEMLSFFSSRLSDLEAEQDSVNTGWVAGSYEYLAEQDLPDSGAEEDSWVRENEWHCFCELKQALFQEWSDFCLLLSATSTQA